MDNFLIVLVCFAVALSPLVALAQEGDGEDCPSSKLDYLGCHGEATLDRFTRALPDSANNSVLGCTGRCRGAGYTYAAMVNGTGCRCGRLQPVTRLRRDSAECDAPCPGEPERECGGRGRVDRANVYYVEPEGCDWIKVVESDDHQDYFATNVLVDGCSDPSVKGMNTWWAAGGSTQFIAQLGCEKLVDRVTLRNPRFGGRSFYPGTKDFELHLSDDMHSWTKVLTGSLSRGSEEDCSTHPVFTTIRFRPTRAKYARFFAKSLYGHRIGLEYFGIAGPPNCTCNGDH